MKLKKFGILRWIRRGFAGLWLPMIASCLLGILRVGVSLTFVWFSKRIVDAAVAPHSSGRTIIGLAFVLVALMLTEMCLSLASSYLNSKNEVKAKNKLRAEIYKSIMHNRWDATMSMHSGDMLSRLTEDVRVITDAVFVKFPEVIVMLAQLVGAFIFLLWMSPTLALCVGAIMPLCLLLSKVYVQRMRHITRSIREADSRIHANMQEGLVHRMMVKALECADILFAKLDTLQTVLFAETMRRTRFSTFSRAMIRLGFIAGFLAAFLWSVWHLHEGTITFGTMTAFLQLVARIQNPMVSLAGSLPSLVHALTSTDRLIQVDQQPKDSKECHIIHGPAAGVRIDAVTFSYTGNDNYVLRDFHHDFTPGSKTVIMGETGIGKSTMIKLILGLIRPAVGTVKVYSDHGEFAVDASTRCNMTYVPQGNSLMEGSIRDNLRLGKKDATEAEMREALVDAVGEFVYDLPMGLDTPCGEQGTQLSEGQAQRIAIARALLRDRPIMLLDEFNSALDSTTAAQLIERLMKRCAGKTMIFISHRTDIQRYCDTTLRLPPR